MIPDGAERDAELLCPIITESMQALAAGKHGNSGCPAAYGYNLRMVPRHVAYEEGLTFVKLAPVGYKIL
jgi:hypothetical protein